ncbi:MAG: TraR/DksA family transcriptional regulator [Actinomycetes bacterium]
MKQPAATKSAAKQPRTKSSTAKKTAAKKTVVKKAAVKKPASKRPAPKKPVAKKPVPKKPVVNKKTPAKKLVAQKAPAKKAAPKKTPAKKTVVKKAPAKKAPAKTAAPKAASSKAAASKAAASKAAASKAASSKVGTEQVAPEKAADKAVPKSPVKPLKQAATATVPRPSARGRKPLTPAEREEMKGVLLAERQRLEHEIASAVEDLNELLRDSGDGSGDDQADAGSKTFEREHEMSVANNSRDLLVQVEHALGRIADGTYGTCESCGLPIGKMRLEAFPRATLCVDCKQREERR